MEGSVAGGDGGDGFHLSKCKHEEIGQAMGEMDNEFREELSGISCREQEVGLVRALKLQWRSSVEC